MKGLRHQIRAYHVPGHGYYGPTRGEVRVPAKDFGDGTVTIEGYTELDRVNEVIMAYLDHVGEPGTSGFVEIGHTGNSRDIWKSDEGLYRAAYRTDGGVTFEVILNRLRKIKTPSKCKI